MSRPIVVALAAALTVSAGVARAQQTSSGTPPKRPTLDELEARARRDSLDPEAHFRLAQRYDRLNRLDDEERELHATIAVDPRYAPAYLWLGDLPFDRRPKLWEEDRKGKVPEALRPGTYVLVLRVRDAAGNVGSGDVVFTVQPRKGPR